MLRNLIIFLILQMDLKEKLMEYWEVLDGEGNPTGEIMKKYDKNEKN